VKTATRDSLEWLLESARARALFGPDPELARIVAVLIAALLADTPPAGDGPAPPPRHPWATLQVGETFRVEVVDPARYRRTLTNLSSAGIQWAKRHAPERRFAVRRSTDSDVIYVKRLEDRTDGR
jgi:hypothetical protein